MANGSNRGTSYIKGGDRIPRVFRLADVMQTPRDQQGWPDEREPILSTQVERAEFLRWLADELTRHGFPAEPRGQRVVARRPGIGPRLDFVLCRRPGHQASLSLAPHYMVDDERGVWLEKDIRWVDERRTRDEVVATARKVFSIIESPPERWKSTGLREKFKTILLGLPSRAGAIADARAREVDK